MDGCGVRRRPAACVCSCNHALHHELITAARPGPGGRPLPHERERRFIGACGACSAATVQLVDCWHGEAPSAHAGGQHGVTRATIRTCVPAGKMPLGARKTDTRTRTSRRPKHRQTRRQSRRKGRTPAAVAQRRRLAHWADNNRRQQQRCGHAGLLRAAYCLCWSCLKSR